MGQSDNVESAADEDGAAERATDDALVHTTARATELASGPSEPANPAAAQDARVAHAHKQRMTSLWVLGCMAICCIISGTVLALVSGALVPVLSLFGIAAFCITFVAPLGSGMAVTTEQSAKMLRALSPQSKENGDTK